MAIRMKVLMVTALPPSGRFGGAEKFCRNLSMKLVEKGLEVRILTSSSHNPVEGMDVSGLEISGNLVRIENLMARKFLFDYFSPENRRLLRSEIEDYNPDLVHFHGIYGIGSDLIQFSLKRLPTVATIHDCWPFCFRGIASINGKECDLRCFNCRFPLGSLTRLIKINQVRNAVLIAPSKYLTGLLLSAGFKNVKHIYNAIDVLDYAFPKLNRRILFVGRLVPEKGIEYLCEACINANVPLDIIGTGPLLNSLNKKFNNYNNINFLGFMEDVSEQYQKGGVIAVPSICPDNFPTVLLEAMSFGIPAIASNIGGIPEIVKDGYNGRLFAPGDLNELTEEIDYLMTGNRMDLLGRNAIKTIIGKFNWQSTVNSYIDTYGSIIH